MNIRLSPQDVRVRISRKEYEKLSEEFILSETIHFPLEQHFVCRIVVDREQDFSSSDLRVFLKDNCVDLFISEEALSELSSPGAAKEGIRGKEVLKDGAELVCSLQIDLGKGKSR